MSTLRILATPSNLNKSPGWKVFSANSYFFIAPRATKQLPCQSLSMPHLIWTTFSEALISDLHANLHIVQALLKAGAAALAFEDAMLP